MHLHQHNRWKDICTLTTLLLPLLLTSTATHGGDNPDLNGCLLKGLEQAQESMTVGELRAACREKIIQAEPAADEPASEAEVGVDSAIVKRYRYERAQQANPFSILPHRPNYIIASYNTSDPDNSQFQQAVSDKDVEQDHGEVKFQVSFKLPLMYDIFGDRGDLFVAYTNRSFWQVFNDDVSAPFRETDHEPEGWLSFSTGWDLLGLHSRVIRLGVTHQSNGQSSELSRSWNRLYADLIFEKDNLAFSIKPWWRIRESDEDDDNPDIEDFMGHFEFQGIYRRNKHTFGLMARHTLDPDNSRGAVQLDWSFPVHRHVRGYLQLFNGYGESLIDYDKSVNSIGLGIQLTDWL